MAKIESELTDKNHFISTKDWIQLHNADKLAMIKEFKKSGVRPTKSVFHDFDLNGRLVTKTYLSYDFNGSVYIFPESFVNQI